MKKIAFIPITILVICLPVIVKSATYLVTNTFDSGAGSLRQAITDANGSSGGDLITFSIPASDPGYDPIRKVWIFTPASAYPYIIGSGITIDGTTQAVNQGDSNTVGPEIMVDGQNTLANAFILASPGNVIKGLVISRCTYAVVFFNNTGTNNTITECYVGTDETGTLSMGNQYGIGASGNATNNTITKNLISGNTGAGIAIQTAGQTTITGNKIGTDRTGTVAIPNLYGIVTDNGYGNIIGGNTPAARNLISGNTSGGIVMNGAGSVNNVIRGNYIGTDTSGLVAMSNDFGVVLAGAANNTIGGSTPAEKNLISGNAQSGIILNGTGTKCNCIKGNYIGTDASGSTYLANHVGILLKSNAKSNIIGGTTAGERNVISGNDEIGVYLEACDSNVVRGNYVGPDATGMNPFMIGDSMFQANGIELNTVSKYNVVENNVISGNRVYGFVFYGQVSYNDLIGNYIGVDASGNHAMKNATGICVDCAANHNKIYNNVLSGNISYGIFIVTNGTYYNDMKGNLVGTNAAGTDTIPNDIGLAIGGGARYNIIGGDNPADRNIFSGNRFDGIEIADNLTDYNLIVNNYIGTDITGTYALPNVHGIGVTTYPANNVFDGNLVSGNSQMGILLYENADSNVVVNCKIGTDVTGINPLPNGMTGVLIMQGASHNVIGNDSSGNIIAYNGNGGVVLLDDNTRFNTISGNSIHDNQVLGGIDIFPYGCNFNDAGDIDTGPNDMVNYPIIDIAAHDSVSGMTVFYGRLDIPDPDSTIVELFIAAPDPLGCGEGKIYLGQCLTPSGSHWNFASNMPVIGDTITATATDRFGNTSEFSQMKTVNITDGIREIAGDAFEISASPNPFHERVILNMGINGPKIIRIFNATGRCVFREDGFDGLFFTWDGSENDGSRQGKGLFLLNVAYENGIHKTLKIIRQ